MVTSTYGRWCRSSYCCLQYMLQREANSTYVNGCFGSKAASADGLLSARSGMLILYGAMPYRETSYYRGDFHGYGTVVSVVLAFLWGCA